MSYTFTDHDGKKHLVRVHANQWDVLTSFSRDWDPASNSFVNSTATFNMQGQRGAQPNSVDAFLSKPATLTIDAETNPKGAAELISHFHDADATD